MHVTSGHFKHILFLLGSRKSKKGTRMTSSSTMPCATLHLQHRHEYALSKATHVGWGPLLEAVKVLELALKAKVEKTV